jgi:hypothetical protein
MYENVSPITPTDEQTGECRSTRTLSYYDTDPSIQNLGRIVRHCLFVYHIINFITFLAIVCFLVSIIRTFIQHLYNISYRETDYT